MNLKSLFLFLLYSLPSSPTPQTVAFPMVFLMSVNNNSILLFVWDKNLSVSSLIFFFLILRSHQIHQQIHLVLPSKYIQNIFVTTAPLSMSQVVSSWKLILRQRSVGRKVIRECSWDQQLRRKANGFGQEKKLGCDLGTIKASAASTRSSEPGQPLGTVLNRDESPGLYRPYWPVTGCRPPWEGRMPLGKQLFSEKATLEEGWQPKAICWGPPSCCRNQSFIPEGELNSISHITTLHHDHLDPNPCLLENGAVAFLLFPLSLLKTLTRLIFWKYKLDDVMLLPKANWWLPMLCWVKAKIIAMAHQTA